MLLQEAYNLTKQKAYNLWHVAGLSSIDRVPRPGLTLLPQPHGFINQFISHTGESAQRDFKSECFSDKES